MLEEISTPEFSVERLEASDSEYPVLADVIALPYIYYLAPHTGCGCGWECLNRGSDSEKQSLDSVDKLSAYLHRAVTEGEVRILSTCTETVDRKPDSWQQLPLSKFMPDLQRWRVQCMTPRAALVELAA